MKIILRIFILFFLVRLYDSFMNLVFLDVDFQY
jgi:hypothetical protein